MKTLLYYLIPLSIIVAVVIAVAPAKTVEASAVIYGKQSSAISTSTLAYMTPGTATTTLAFDAYVNEVTPAGYINTNSANGTIGDSITVLIQYTASTSNSILRVRPEISEDGIDWYPYSTILASNSTSTPIVSNYGDYQWNLSTSTASTAGQIGLGGTSNGMRVHQAITINNLPTRYVRFLFYIPPGAPNGAIWTEGWVKKELPL